MKNGFSLDADTLRPLMFLTHTRSRGVLTGAIILAIVYVIAKTSWSLLPLNVALPSKMPSQVASSGNDTPAKSVDLSAITQVNWFGAATQGTQNPSESTHQPSLSLAEAEAVESNLRINLLGVILAEDERLSRIIIDQQGKHQQFAVGESLPAGRNVKLLKVLSDRVIIDNGGRYEYIALYESDQQKLGQVAAQPQPVAANLQEADIPEDTYIDHSNDAEVSAMLVEVKQKVLSDPASLMQLVTIGAHYQDGELVGYTLAPGSMGKEFNQLGLQTGDILVAVNGMPLNTPQAMPQVMAAMQSGMVDLELLRNGGSVNISVSMDTP